MSTSSLLKANKQNKKCYLKELHQTNEEEDLSRNSGSKYSIHKQEKYGSTTVRIDTYNGRFEVYSQCKN